MHFYGLSKVFPTKDDGQYEAIGEFWDFMAARYGRENLLGLGYNWTDSTITYAIGLRHGKLNPEISYPGAAFQDIALPDCSWERRAGKTEQLSQLYEQIYSDGALRFEIEAFREDGSCEVHFIRA